MSKTHVIETIGPQLILGAENLSPLQEYVVGPQHQIVWAYGPTRKAAAAYLERNHYMRSSGGSGALFAVINTASAKVCGACLINPTTSENCDRSLISGAALIGPTGSQDAERSIAAKGVLIRQIKRSHMLDGVPMYESHLLRTAMQAVTDHYGKPTLYVSYADEAALDERTLTPMFGGSYLAAGFFFAGFTTGRRWCVIDHAGRARSTRQGAITLKRTNLPKAGEVFHGEHISADWIMKKLPPARVWIAIVTPSSYTRKQAKSAYLAVWRQLNPERRVAAKLWVNHVEWRRKLAAGTVPIGEPRPQHIRELDRFQPAYWRGDEMTRTAAPIMPPQQWQQRVIFEADVAGETTARRLYAPLMDV